MVLVGQRSSGISEYFGSAISSVPAVRNVVWQEIFRSPLVNTTVVIPSVFRGSSRLLTVNYHCFFDSGVCFPYTRLVNIGLKYRVTPLWLVPSERPEGYFYLIMYLLSLRICKCNTVVLLNVICDYHSPQVHFKFTWTLFSSRSLTSFVLSCPLSCSFPPTGDLYFRSQDGPYSLTPRCQDVVCVPTVSVPVSRYRSLSTWDPTDGLTKKSRFSLYHRGRW